ncbi:MAG TPA: hypothetical protein VK669_03845 [Candidatus Limnocylindrales bacterium]|nr:hypothetical protein [Candidatus Limnocylindrales bacterium]
MPSMTAIRQNVSTRVTVKDPVAKGDLLDPARTHDNLVLALDEMTAPAPDGLGHKLFLSAVYSDHCDDSNLGPHGHHPGHNPGWAIDVATVDGIDVGDNHQTRQLIRDLLACEKVTKVGTLPAVANRADLQAVANATSKALFEDAGTGPHVHFQSSEAV